MQVITMPLVGHLSTILNMLLRSKFNYIKCRMCHWTCLGLQFKAITTFQRYNIIYMAKNCAVLQSDIDL